MGNLSYEVTREELIEAFGAAGPVVDVKVPTDRETGRPRGFAFVEFESDDAVRKSIELLNGTNVRGRPLRVNAAEDRPPRPPGGGPGGGGGGFGERPFSPRPPRPSFGGGPPPPRRFEAPASGNGVAPTEKEMWSPRDSRERPERPKGSRRGLRRRKRGFD